MPRIRTPREARNLVTGTPSTPTQRVRNSSTPPQPREAVFPRALENLGGGEGPIGPVKEQISDSGEQDISGYDLRALVPMLNSNFSKLHASNALILAKLQGLDEAHQISSRLSSGILRDIQRRSRLPSVNGQSSDLPITANKSLKSLKSTTGTLGSLGTVGENIQEHFSSRSPMRFSGLVSITNKDGMEQLNEIIMGHSKHILRKGSRAHAIWVFLENRTSSPLAYYYGSYFAPFFLILSVLISFIQTVEEWAMPDKLFTAIQTVFELWFACEITVRFCVCPNKASFWCDTFNMIDFFSVAPLLLRIYIMAADLEGTSLQTVIALVPILRLLKILRRFHKFQLLVSAFSIALEALPVLMFSLMLIAIVFSGLVYLIESRQLISDLPQAIWFVMVTMSTVGYGDIVPETRLGQFLSVILMILSALYMALPIGIVGNAFSEVWRDRDRLLLLAVLRESFAVSGISRALIRDIFEHFSEAVTNQGQDPEMSYGEFYKMLTALQIEVSEERAMALFQALDEDGSGNLSCDEFIHKLFPSYFLSRVNQSFLQRGTIFQTSSDLDG